MEAFLACMQICHYTAALSSSLEWAIFYTKAAEDSVTGNIVVIIFKKMQQKLGLMKKWWHFLQTITFKVAKNNLKLQKLQQSVIQSRWTSDTKTQHHLLQLYFNLFLWVPPIQRTFCFNKDIFCHLNLMFVYSS